MEKIEFDYKTLKQIVIINNKVPVYTILLLKDGRLISCQEDPSINIYDKLNFQLQKIITLHNRYITYITQLKNEKIITCSLDATMKIIKLNYDYSYIIEQILDEHQYFVMKIIEIYNGKLISCSGDKTIKIWGLENKNNLYQFELNIFVNKNSIDSIIEIPKKKEILSASSFGKKIFFFDTINYSIKCTLLDISCCCFYSNSLCLINDDLIGIYGNNIYYIINCNNYQLSQKFIFGNTLTSYKLLNGKIIVGIMGGLMFLNIKSNNIVQDEYSEYFIHDKEITCIIESKNEYFNNKKLIITCSLDSTIKFFVEKKN